MEETLNVSWMEDYEKYQIFYKEKVENIKVFYIYIDNENNICYTKCDKREIMNQKLSKEELLFMIKNNITMNKYRFHLHSILQFNINLEHNDILQNKIIDKIPYEKIECIEDIHWKSTINFFIDINSLYIIFHKPQEKSEKIISIHHKKTASKKKTKRHTTRKKQYLNLV